MTESQRKAKFGSFLSAGYAAFYADIPTINNPYREQPFRDLWAKGWRDAEREHKRKIPFRHKGYTDDRTFDDRRQKFFKPFKPRFVPKPVIKRGGTYVKDGVIRTPSVNRFDKFNNKFRTKV